MSLPILLDLTHTSHTRARTGIQRLARSLWREWGGAALPVCRDPYSREWRILERWELDNLAHASPSADRKAQWPIRTKFRGWAGRVFGRRRKGGMGGGAFLCPEIFSPSTADALPEIFAAANGPRAALFHDAAALKFPELTPSKTVARYPAYLQRLLQFDGIAAISEESRDALVGYWKWLGRSDTPPVTAIAPGVDPPNPAFAMRGLPRRGPTGEGGPTLLCVCTIEGRKNHMALLEACESLWKAGLRFELRLIGLVNRETGREARMRIASLQRSGRPLRYDGAMDDGILEEAYRTCAFTVYPSLAEGFGLPIAESLARGKPCLCSGSGATGEIARGGGCLPLERLDSRGLAAAIERILRSPAELAALTAAAEARPVRTWADYARELAAWLETLARRP